MSATPGRLLERAVHHHNATSRKGILERLFTFWFQGFVYNQIWEDPRVDAEAMQLGPGHRVLAISSGGCNVLNYLVHRPDKIVAVDLNPNHMCLTRLKLAALRHLPDHDAFYTFFGLGNRRENVENYHRYIRPHLDEQTRRHWETTHWPGGKIGKPRIHYFAEGFYNHSKMALFFRFVQTLTRCLQRDPAELLKARTLQEQEKFFDEVVSPFFHNRLVHFVTSLPATVFSLGIPPSQHQVMRDESDGQLVDLYCQRLRKLLCAFPLHDNYFAWQAVARRYDHANRQGIPDYLRAENYAMLRNRVDRVETHITSLDAYLQGQPDLSLDRFVLLDSQDWMPPAVIAGLWAQIARVGRRGTRVIFRTAGTVSPIEDALPAELRSRFIYEKELSLRLHEQDRSAIYGMFHTYSMPGPASADRQQQPWVVDTPKEDEALVGAV